ncbi:MAG: ABC transporter substrate-binding protein, partial [Alphaproteobacteria bacterium]|nr:ABC transporter substrate-binding protein [Alphaproteobacteria bacterium]
DKVDAIISIESRIGLAINPIAERAGVVHIAIASDEAAARGRFNFALAVPAEIEAKKLVRQFQKHGVGRVAILTMNQGGYIMRRDALMREVSKAGIKTVAEFTSNQGERDFRIITARMLAEKPDIVVVLAHMPDLQIFIRQLREQNKTIPITTKETFGFLDDKSLVDGMYYVDVPALADWFVRDMRIETGRDSTPMAEYQYAALDVIVSGFEYAGPDTAAVADAIPNMVFTSAIDEFGFSPEGVAQTAPSLRMVKNGVAVLVKE